MCFERAFDPPDFRICTCGMAVLDKRVLGKIKQEALPSGY